MLAGRRHAGRIERIVAEMVESSAQQ